MEASLAYLARFASTRKSLALYLRKKFVAPESGELEPLIEACLTRLEELQLIDDARYTEDRARGLRAQGKSARAIRDRLRKKGAPGEMVDDVLRGEDDEAELVAAVRHTKRRRLGPFRRAPGEFTRELAVMARAGYSYEIARRALELSLSDAEALIQAR